MKNFNLFLSENYVSASQLKHFETLIDSVFKKFGIDFEFSKHFAERLNDSRNKPGITIEELRDLIKKIYFKKGNPLKNKPGTEAVILDAQSNINIPVKIEYDSRNDEIDIVAKTIMRKNNFYTPDPIIKY